MNRPAFSAFPDVITHYAALSPKSTCLSIRGQQITWKELLQVSSTVANSLVRQLPTQTVPRIALRLDDEVKFIWGLFGALMAGGAVIPLPAPFSDETLRRLLVQSTPAVILVDANTENGIGRLGIGTELRLLEDLLRPKSGQVGSRRRINPEDEMTILYSSGTTGAPRGVVHTHRARCCSAEIQLREYRLDRKSNSLISAPLYTGRALAPIFATLYAGGCVTIVPERNDAELIAALGQGSFSTYGVVPTQLEMIASDDPKKLRMFSRIDQLVCGGSSLSSSVRNVVFETLSHNFVEVYGATETDLIAKLEPGAPREKQGSVGRPAHTVDVKIVDDNDDEVELSERGEIVVSSPANMQRYVGGAETAEPFVQIDAASYYKTGDIGWLDDDGYLWLAGRKKDMIITAGFNIFPTDIERILLDHPSVAEAAVIGVPIQILGEAPYAYVVLKERSPHITSGDIGFWANARLNRNQKLLQVEIRSTLPKNANGKVMKRLLRDEWMVEQFLP